MSAEIAKLLLTATCLTAAPLCAETLVAGATYFDSLPTLAEVRELSAQHDDESIAILTENGHIKQTKSDMTVVILLSGSIPEEPAEFRFLNGPTTFWTFTKNVTGLSQPIATETPTPTPVIVASSPSPSATPEVTPTPTPAKAMAKRTPHKHESDNPPDDDNGRRIWHKVNGKWKWYDKPKPVRRALPVEPQTTQ
jgi:hypothetical protein